MALLKRELYRRVTGPKVTRVDGFTLVFDTDSKSLYVERELGHLDTSVVGSLEYRTTTMDIADYLKQGRSNCRSPRTLAVIENAFQGRQRQHRLPDVAGGELTHSNRHWC